MGATMAATAIEARGCRGRWIPIGRSVDTVARAEAAGLTPLGSHAELADVDIVISICPPDAAVDVAVTVAATGFTGPYVDANAIAPATAKTIARIVDRYVDGSVIGPPPTDPGLARLYLSGADAAEVAEVFRHSSLEPVVLGVGDGDASTMASAIKMAYAGWTKGSAALLLGIVGLARAEGVEDALMDEWARSQPGVLRRLEQRSSGPVAKAWRFAGEMDEIAATFAANDLPDGFHAAAADIYRRLSGFRDDPAVPLDAAIAALLTDHDDQTPTADHSD